MNCKLGDIAEIIMGQSPESSYYNSTGDGTPFLQGNRTFGFRCPSFDTYTTKVTKMCKAGDTIMSVRAPVGDLNIAPVDFCLGRGVCSIRAKDGINQVFIYYLLKHYVKFLVNAQNGTVFGSVNRKDISDLVIPDIPINVQNKIVHFLSSIDDKIELNNKINDNLQQQSLALFNSFYDSIHGNEVCFQDNHMFGKLIMGQSPKGESYNTDMIGVPLINGAADYTNMILTPQKFTSAPTRVCKKNDLIFCIRATIGLLVFADKEYCLGRGVASISATNDEFVEFIYHIINRSIEHLKNQANGSVIVGINKDDILKLKIKMPSLSEITEFHKLQKPLFNTVEKLRLENICLKELRDALLPKLMSGEIDVSNINLDL